MASSNSPDSQFTDDDDDDDNPQFIEKGSIIPNYSYQPSFINYIYIVPIVLIWFDILKTYMWC
jgi:hypothetical protein